MKAKWRTLDKQVSSVKYGYLLEGHLGRQLDKHKFEVERWLISGRGEEIPAAGIFRDQERNESFPGRKCRVAGGWK